MTACFFHGKDSSNRLRESENIKWVSEKNMNHGVRIRSLMR
jgi:hypothetical protein